MAELSMSALDTALAYHRAWISHDFEAAVSYLADDVVCDAPAGRLNGIVAFRGFMGPFVEIVTSAALRAAFGDETTAVLIYDTDTIPVKDAPGAELSRWKTARSSTCASSSTAHRSRRLGARRSPDKRGHHKSSIGEADAIGVSKKV